MSCQGLKNGPLSAVSRLKASVPQLVTLLSVPRIFFSWFNKSSYVVDQYLLSRNFISNFNVLILLKMTNDSAHFHYTLGWLVAIATWILFFLSKVCVWKRRRWRFPSLLSVFTHALTPHAPRPRLTTHTAVGNRLVYYVLWIHQVGVSKTATNYFLMRSLCALVSQLATFAIFRAENLQPLDENGNKIHRSLVWVLVLI